MNLEQNPERNKKIIKIGYSAKFLKRLKKLPMTKSIGLSFYF